MLNFLPLVLHSNQTSDDVVAHVGGRDAGSEACGFPEEPCGRGISWVPEALALVFWTRDRWLELQVEVVWVEDLEEVSCSSRPPLARVLTVYGVVSLLQPVAPSPDPFWFPRR